MCFLHNFKLNIANYAQKFEKRTGYYDEEEYQTAIGDGKGCDNKSAKFVVP